MIDDLEIGTNSITKFTESSLTRAPLSSPHAGHQSRAFSVTLAVNPLVAAAAPLLSITSQLSEQTEAPDLKELFESLCHEIKALETKAHSLGYRPQVILAARYLLCSLIDETIFTTSWGKGSEWKKQNLLKTFQREAWGGERFFVILERCAEEPLLYIDLLELGYICLSLGFQGKYRKQNNLNGLTLVIDNLYDLIRHQRGEFSRRLLVAPSEEQPEKPSHWRLPSIWATALFTAAILTAIFVPYYHHLEKISTPINQAIQNIGQFNE